ncbi:MAG: polyprenyl synthetase family protein [Clostridia bacterium]|nr:polyprenyl synthetase family protein [Clostridia bacterium]
MWNNYPEILSELNLIEEELRIKVLSRNRLLSEIVGELLNAGGKRLRPAFVVIAAKFGNYDSKKVIPVAGALEILHTATLVHDDIIDKAKIRRGKQTISEKYGADLAVYAGDFLFAKSMMMLSRDISLDRLDGAASAIKIICEGEVDQYLDKFNANTSVYSYLKRISRKTAVLFAAACALGANTSECPEDLAKKLSRFGFYYGIAFQIRDDINDFISSEEAQGKPVGKDLREGILTLPAILAAGRDSKVREAVSLVFEKRNQFQLEDIRLAVELVREFKGIEDAGIVLEKYIDRGVKVLETLPPNPYIQLMKDLINSLKPVKAKL